MKIYYPGMAPAGGAELRLDQLEAIHRIKQEVTFRLRSGAALLGAGMGSGKTVVTVEVILSAKPERCLIVGVRDAYSQWQSALSEQSDGRLKLLRISNTKSGRENLAKLLDGESGIFYAGLEMLRAQDWDTEVSETHAFDPAIRDYFARAGEELGERTEPVKRRVHKRTYANMKTLDLLISDESHKHSNQKTASLKTIGDIPTRGKIALSGTFFGNKFENAWSLTTWLWGKQVIGARKAWDAKYCAVEPVMTKWGKQVKSPSGFRLTKITGEKNPGEFVQTLPCYVFIATPIGAVPKPEIVQVDLHPEQLRQYTEMQTQSLTWIETEFGKKHEPLVADLPIVQRTRLRTAALGGMTLVAGEGDASDSITFQPGCKSSTLTAAYEVLHRPDWVGQKALILTHSKQFAIEVARRIGAKYTTALKTGDVASAQWDVDKARFMLQVLETNSIQYLVAVIGAVGTATDGLQRSCSRVLWLSEDDSNVNNIQAANRVWRDGVDLDSYAAVKLVTRNTIAEGVLTKNVKHKASLLDSVQGAG
jgi:hypothetical protein